MTEVAEGSKSENRLQQKAIIPYIALIFVAVIYTDWYPQHALTSLTHYAGGGFFNGGNYPIYSFTYAGAVLSVVGVTYFILKQENFKLMYLPIALGVSYLATISATVWYEQIWIGLGTLFAHFTFWANFYGSLFEFLGVIANASLVLVLYPWIRWRKNKNLILYSFLSLFILFGIWIAAGYGFTWQSTIDWTLNASTRIMSQIILIVLVFVGRTQ